MLGVMKPSRRLEPKNVCGCVMIHGLLWHVISAAATRLFWRMVSRLRKHSDTGFAYTQHPSIHNGAPGDVPDLRTYTAIDSVNVTTDNRI